MDPKNLSQLDPKLREAYERVMGPSLSSTPSDSPSDPKPADPPPVDPQPSSPPVSSSPMTEPIPPQQPSPIEPIPTITAASNNQSAELASPSVFGVDVPPPPPPPPMQMQDPVQQAPIGEQSSPEPMDVPPPPPPPPSVAQNDPNIVAPQADPSTNVNAAATPNKIIPILIVVALVILLVVWGFFWIQLLL